MRIPGRVAGTTLACMEHVPPPAEELVILDRELARLDLRRSQLLTRRTWLLNVLQAPGPRLYHAARAAVPAASGPCRGSGSIRAAVRAARSPGPYR